MNLKEKQKFNLKLFPIYKMFAWDLLFYYAISFLFFTQVKGFSSSDVVLIDVSIYTLFRAFMQVPSAIIVDKLGRRMGLIIGNVFVSFSIMFIILCPNIYFLAFAEFLMALGYSIKSIGEPDLVYDALSGFEKKGEIFSKLDGKGTSFYYYLNAISCLFTGFLYSINPYLPVFICLLFCIISTLISTRFYSLHDREYEFSKDAPKALDRLKDYSKELKFTFKKIIKSSRLRYLIVFYGLFQSIIFITNTLDRSLLTDLNVPSQYLGIIYALLAILSGISSNSQNWFHTKFRNRVLTVFSVFFIGSCTVAGLSVILKVPFSITIFVVILSIAIRALIKGPFYTLYKKYLSNFASSSARTKIYSTTYFFENICTSAIAFLVSRILSGTSTAVAITILGVSYGFVFVFLLYGMKSHVGLSPEQYKKEDLDLKDLR